MSVAGDQSDVGQRADKLVRAMTQAEKIGLVTGHYPVPMRDEDRPSDALIAAGYIPGIPRLGFPSLKETDASLGVSNVVEMRPGDVATALPCGLAMGATFNADLIEAGGAMIGLEAKSKGFHVLLAGGVNLVRDAWNGRNFEYLGEDPLHSGILGGAAIRGVQSNKMVSTIKHFALNPQESGRKVMSANIEEAGFRESDLLAFQIAIEMGNPHSVMCSYNRVNGTYASANPFLLTDVLRRDWNYRGWVMSDWGAVHATAAAANAGLDQESGQELDSEVFFGDALRRAIEGGEVSAERLDEMTYRIVHGALASGVVDSPPVIAQVDYEAHAAIAQTVAEEGCVLLHNDGTLPLSDATARSILVVGGHASVGVLSGGGSSQVRSVGGVPVEIALMRGEASGFSRRTYHASSPLVALRETMPKCKFTYVDGTDHETVVRLAEQADLTIIFAEQWQTEAHDVPNLSLPDEQDSLIADVASVAQTVVVLETGGAVLMPWIDEVAAVLAAWYPGQRGGEAIARIISGAVNPSGRLPVSFPKSEQDLPRPAPIGLDLQEAAESKRLPGKPSVAYSIPPFDVDYDEGADIGYRWFERNGTATLFPFGHGLSYTDFSYENFAVHDGQAPVVEFTVRNTGKVSGIDTPQVYFVPTRGRPRRLVGWERVTLDAGEAQHVSITVDLRLIADFSVEERVWKVADGEARFVLAKSAEHCASEARLKMASRSLAA